MWVNPGDASLLLAGNSLLSSLNHCDLQLLLPHLLRVGATHGDTLFDTGEPLEWVYFPETAIVALVERDGTKHSIETGLVGREGFVGWPSILGCTVATCRAEIQLEGGTLLAIRATHLAAACDASRTLLTALLQFVQAVTVQMSCTMLANSNYPLANRLARWLVMRHDRMSHDTLTVQHDEISMCLGVRRASVTDCLHLLEGEQLIRSRRGKITVRDRDGLRARAGECYGVAEAHHQSALDAACGKPGASETRLAAPQGEGITAAPTLFVNPASRSLSRS